MLAFGQTIRQSICNVKDPLHVTARSGLLVRGTGWPAQVEADN